VKANKNFLSKREARTRAELFTVVFYGRLNFYCKTAQLYATDRERRRFELPSVSIAMQISETMRNSLGLNYESPALTAELQARRAGTREHRTFNVQRPIFPAGLKPNQTQSAGEKSWDQSDD
jgi:hypothetical protein